LRIVVSEQGTMTTVALDGGCDLAQQEARRHAIRSALARQPERKVLELTHLTFTDSSGIHGVLELARRAARLKMNVVVIPAAERSNSGLRSASPL
jgi:anti-anti-sigma factor